MIMVGKFGRPRSEIDQIGRDWLQTQRFARVALSLLEDSLPYFEPYADAASGGLSKEQR
jgi:hypothetical protein